MGTGQVLLLVAVPLVLLAFVEEARRRQEKMIEEAKTRLRSEDAGARDP